MPFALLIIGSLALIVAVRGTQDALWQLLKEEFTGPDNFIVWALAIVVLGALGYARPIRPIVDAMIGLIIIAIVLQDQGRTIGRFVDAFAAPVAPGGSTSSAAPRIALPSLKNIIPSLSPSSDIETATPAPWSYPP